MTRSGQTEPTQAPEPPLPATRREFAVIVVIVLVGAALRFAYPSRLAVEHFDEGVYASNIWFGEASDYRYPARHLYAPPLLPSLVEWSIILFGVGPISVKLVSLLAGSATVGVVWWVGRRWFGREAGMAAAVLAALSDVHIIYSRMVLTDVLMCLCLLIAVACVHEMLARGRQGWAVAAGLATGLAWLTKYNGWLPVAIATSGFVFYEVIARWKSKETSVSWRGFAISIVLMTITAAVVWSPAWFDLQDRGGYAAVAANHRGYLVGLEGWLGSLKRQVGNHRYLEGWLSLLSLGTAMLAAVFVARREQGSFTWNSARNSLMFAFGLGLLLSASFALFGVSVTLGALTAVAILTHITRVQNARESTPGVCLLAVWFTGLLLTTPLYFPYPRLTLPWLIATWMGGGIMIGRLVGPNGRSEPEAERIASTTSRDPLSIGVLVTGCLAVAIAALVSWGEPPWHRTPTWRSQSGLRTIAAAVLDDAQASIKEQRAGSRSLFQIYAEPGLLYQMAAETQRRQATSLVVPLGSLSLQGDSPDLPTFLLTGPNAHRAPTYNRDVLKLRDRVELVAEYAYVPSDVVLLNWYPPNRSRRSGRPGHRIRLYRVR